jgi:hypothetical protein
LKKDNELRRRQLDELHLPGNLERRARELNLGLVPARATQVVRLPEPQTDTPPPTRPQNIYPASQARLAPHDLPPPSVGVSAGGTGPTGARRTNGLNM